MSCAVLYAPQLRAQGFRMTPQRMAILHVLHHSGAHLSPVEIYRQARQDVPGLTEPTVYRTLDFLAEHGVVQPAQLHGGHLVYQIAETRHHHVICRVCGNEVEVGHKVLEKMYRGLESATGYSGIDSHVTFFGVCPDCQNAETQSA